MLAAFPWPACNHHDVKHISHRLFVVGHIIRNALRAEPIWPTRRVRVYKVKCMTFEFSIDAASSDLQRHLRDKVNVRALAFTRTAHKSNQHAK